MKLYYYLQNLYIEWKYRDVPDDVCCCGDYVTHSPWDGHSPVSMKGYAISCYMNSLKHDNPYRRRFLQYSVSVRWYGPEGYHTAIRKLDFLSYHLIRYFHGDAGLKKIALSEPRADLKWDGVDYSSPVVL